MPYGPQATLYLAKLVLNKTVVATTHKKDRYGRSVAILYFGDQDVNLSVVRAGLAWHYKQYAKEQDSDTAKVYAEAEDSAKLHRKGLWQSEDATAPWIWRKKMEVRR